MGQEFGTTVIEPPKINWRMGELLTGGGRAPSAFVPKRLTPVPPPGQ